MTVDTAISADNKGYKMLQMMGWGGKGLGRNENGMPLSGSSQPPCAWRCRCSFSIQSCVAQLGFVMHYLVEL